MGSRTGRTLLELSLVIGGLAILAGLSIVIYRTCSTGLTTLVKDTGSRLETLTAEVVSKNIELYYKDRIVHDPKVDAAVNELVNRFQTSAAQRETGLSNQTLRILVIDDPTVNAVTLPGGLIVIYRGLIDILESPEQLAAVLAHEIGHVANGDIAEALTRKMAIGIITAALGDPSGQSGQAVIGDLIDIQFTRMAEERADALACRLLPAIGLSPNHLSDAFKNIESNTPRGLDLPILNDHPPAPERIKLATEAAKNFAGPEKPFEFLWAPFVQATRVR